MNNDTKQKLTSGTNQADLTSGNACWETPPEVYAKLKQDFGPFDLDLTADATRHLGPRWFGPGSALHPDALAAVWNDHGSTGYSNPPYGPFVQQMLAKAAYEARQGFSSTLLLPMRVTRAFRAHVLPYAQRLLFCSSRLTFFENGGPRLNVRQWNEHRRLVADPAVFDSIIVGFGPLHSRDTRDRCQIGEWSVPPHVSADDLERAAKRRGWK